MRALPGVFLFSFWAAACASPDADTLATNAGHEKEAGTTVHDGSSLPPVDATGEQPELPADGSSDASADTIDPAFCASQQDGTECGQGDACHDPPTCLNGQCMPNPKPDGTVCAAASGPCQDDGLCTSGQCSSPTQAPDGTVCAPAPDACHEDGVCSDGICGAPAPRADGSNWDPSDTWKRCCGGEPLRMDSDENCGVCGIACNPSNGESCQVNSVNGQYYCTGCIASAECWSGCCSVSYGTPHRCAASDCVQGDCVGCPGGSCKTWSDASNSCSYD